MKRPSIKLPSVPGPRNVAQRALRGPLQRPVTGARRTGVRVLTQVARVPIARPAAERGMRLLFTSFAPRWEAIRADPTYREGVREALAHLPRNFRPRRTLDVACGTGLGAGIVLERWQHVSVTGTDIAPGMIERARELVPNATFEVASVHDLPFDDGSFDLVLAVDGLLDLPEMLRVTHRKGRLVIVFSRGGTTPISRPVADVASALEQLDAIAVTHTDGEAHVVIARHRR
jgi:SAM-dependent methyltransferase